MTKKITSTARAAPTLLIAVAAFVVASGFCGKSSLSIFSTSSNRLEIFAVASPCSLVLSVIVFMIALVADFSKSSSPFLFSSLLTTKKS